MNAIVFNYGDAPKPMLTEGLINLRAALRITVPQNTVQRYNTKVKTNVPLVNAETGEITPANQEVHVNLVASKDAPLFIEIGQSVGKFVALTNYELVIL